MWMYIWASCLVWLLGMTVKAFGRRCHLWIALDWAVTHPLTTWIYVPSSGRESFLSTSSSSPFLVLLSLKRTKRDPVPCRTASSGQSAVGWQEMIHFSRTLHRSFIKHISVVINQWTWFIIAMMPLKSVNTAVSGGLPEHLVPLVSPWAIN